MMPKCGWGGKNFSDKHKEIRDKIIVNMDRGGVYLLSQKHFYEHTWSNCGESGGARVITCNVLID